MKLLGSVSSQYRVRLSRVSLYSTRSETSSAASKDSIYGRIWLNRHRTAAITLELDRWVGEGRELRQSEIHFTIKMLRKFQHFEAALRMLDWMIDKGSYSLSAQHIAIRVDLIARARNLTDAENYFDRIPDNLKVGHVYGALLNCYACHKCLDKAETIMQKNRELDFFDTPLPYNIMLNLYSKLGRHEKIDILIREMEEKGIKPDATTYSIRLNAFAAMSSLDSMEKLLTEMEADPKVKVSWDFYLSAANRCLKAGATENALVMLRRAETCIGSETGKAGYEILITQYATTQHKNEVYRIWDLLKSSGRLQNSGYRAMISSLAKLDDIDGAQKILADWLSSHDEFEIQIPGMLINHCYKKGLLEKAEAIVSNVIESGKEPDSIMWNQLASWYCTDQQMDKAVEAMKKAAVVNQPEGYLPNLKTLSACLQYLKKKGDVEAAMDLLRLKLRLKPSS